MGKGAGAKAKRRALIPDPRNDENLIVAQTHLAMIRFHNRMVDRQPTSLPVAQRFQRARRSVTLHYQWLIRHDYLPRIVHTDVLDHVFTNGREAGGADALPTDVPRMPVEFSVAAFRLGHSMIRPAYDWNRRFPDGGRHLDYMFEFSGLGRNLGGEVRLLGNWLAEWRRLYDFVGGGHPDLAAPTASTTRSGSTPVDRPAQEPAAQHVRRCRRHPVRRPAAQPRLPQPDAGVDAQARQRASRWSSAWTPGGQGRGRSRQSQILNGNGGARLTSLSDAARERVATRTPLWFYVLREAETGDGRLRGVGARIVTKTFHRAIEGSRFSIIRTPGFRPNHGRGDTFEMIDLLFFAFAGKKSGIDPLGGS